LSTKTYQHAAYVTYRQRRAFLLYLDVITSRFFQNWLAVEEKNRERKSQDYSRTLFSAITRNVRIWHKTETSKQPAIHAILPTKCQWRGRIINTKQKINSLAKATAIKEKWTPFVNSPNFEFVPVGLQAIVKRDKIQYSISKWTIIN